MQGGRWRVRLVTVGSSLGPLSEAREMRAAAEVGWTAACGLLQGWERAQSAAVDG